MRRPTTAALAALLTLGACRNDDLDLRDVVGTYTIELPATDVAPGYSDSLFISLPIAGASEPAYPSRRKVTSLERRAAAPAGSVPDSLVVWTQPFAVEVRADVVYLTPPCGNGDPVSHCADLWTLRGTLAGERLTLHPRPEMSVPVQRFRRVAR